MTKICIDCKLEKSLSEFYTTVSHGRKKLRPECKVCHLTRKKKYEKKLEDKDTYSYKLKKLGIGILRRTIYKNQNKRNKCYRDKGIKCKIGKNLKEICNFLDSNFKQDILNLLERGEISSVDRIDSNKHYEEGNLRIITFKENSILGLKNANLATSIPVRVFYKDGSTCDFLSISDAANSLNCKRDTVYAHLDGSKTRTGITFKLLNVG
jgi:hypothetical protein